ncbi:hypothetical protein LZ32DRAFT_63125 [Colletotrichum eremochloae]|nr:hypothetical protein LZ32DRAFT_89072 [Colletotrichum eremochloae]KAK2007054.1 hypothetical protein LZ32DRAFT_63125 [Colletotrichum eremochloae]
MYLAHPWYFGALTGCHFPLRPKVALSTRACGCGCGCVCVYVLGPWWMRRQGLPSINPVPWAFGFGILLKKRLGNRRLRTRPLISSWLHSRTRQHASHQDTGPLGIPNTRLPCLCLALFWRRQWPYRASISNPASRQQPQPTSSPTSSLHSHPLSSRTLITTPL